MADYSFEETLKHFSKILKKNPTLEDIKEGKVELTIDAYPIVISRGKFEGLVMEICLGLMVRPIAESRLKELCASNFLGINTGGCTFVFDEFGVSLSIRCSTSGTTPPQENWEWLHRILYVSREWIKVLSLWQEFVPLVPQD